MSVHADHPRIERFLALVRAHAQWHENWAVLAPGDITPYLRTTMMATLGTLALRAPAGELIRFQAVDPTQSGASLTSWLVFRHQGVMFDMEGITTPEKIHRMLREQLKAAGLSSAPFEVVEGSPPNIRQMFTVATGQGLKSITLAEGAWAEAFEADKLQAATPQAKATRARRF